MFAISCELIFCINELNDEVLFSEIGLFYCELFDFLMHFYFIGNKLLVNTIHFNQLP